MRDVGAVYQHRRIWRQAWGGIKPERLWNIRIPACVEYPSLTAADQFRPCQPPTTHGNIDGHKSDMKMQAQIWMMLIVPNEQSEQWLTQHAKALHPIPNLTMLHGSVNWHLHCCCEVPCLVFEMYPCTGWNTPGCYRTCTPTHQNPRNIVDEEPIYNVPMIMDCKWQGRGPFIIQGDIIDEGSIYNIPRIMDCTRRVMDGA